MTDLTAHTAALSGYAHAQHASATDVAGHAARQRSPIGELTMTFGVIGADFLAAMGYTLDRRATTLDEIATRHRDVATGVRDAEQTYTRRDAANAHALRDQELRL